MKFLAFILTLSFVSTGHAQEDSYAGGLAREKSLLAQAFPVGELIACDRDRQVVRINFAPGHSEWRSITRAGDSSTTFDFYDEGSGNHFHLTLRLEDLGRAHSSEGNALRWLLEDWTSINTLCHDLGPRPNLPKSDGLVKLYRLHFRWH